MDLSFILTSGFLFLGGCLTTMIGESTRSDFALVLGVILMLIGGISLFVVWFQRILEIYRRDYDSNPDQRLK